MVQVRSAPRSSTSRSSIVARPSLATCLPVDGRNLQLGLAGLTSTSHPSAPSPAMARSSWTVGRGDAESPGFSAGAPDFGASLGDPAPGFDRGVFSLEESAFGAGPGDWAESPRPIRTEVAPIRARA